LKWIQNGGSRYYFPNPDKKIRRPVEVVEKAKLIYGSTDETTSEVKVIESDSAPRGWIFSRGLREAR
jgi:hypothetical protein